MILFHTFFVCLLAGLGQLASSLFTCFIVFFHLRFHFFNTHCSLICLVFRLALRLDFLCVSTSPVFGLAFCLDLLFVSTCLILNSSTTFLIFGLRLCCSRLLTPQPLTVTSVGGLIIFQMLGAYMDSFSTHIPALWVHLLLLGLSVVYFTLVLYSGTSDMVILYDDFGSSMVIPLLNGHWSTNH